MSQMHDTPVDTILTLDFKLKAQDESSISRLKRANVMRKTTKEDFLSILGDADDKKNPIYMTGPSLHTLCTAVIDLEEQTLSIIEGNPKKGDVSIGFPLSPKKLINGHNDNH
ncbi:acyl-coenzyme A:6-aminopenicillanic acid acyl-transferase, partial [Trifolium medium]|nr:acyl-coenzyme A:6-aminopenicillanic acid acyl-transferase [Trifolium medium]